MPNVSEKQIGNDEFMKRRHYNVAHGGK